MLDVQLLDFMTETAKSLGEIKATQRGMKEDITEMKDQCDKIPLIEQGLNNHLTTHATLKRFFIWPLTVVVSGGVVGGIILALLKYAFGLI